MKEFLRKIKLIDTLTMHLDISREDFVEKLSQITSQEKTGLLVGLFEAFSQDNSTFSGKVSFAEFKIRKRFKFFETSQIIPVANGTIVENNGQLTVETEINGVDNFLIFFNVFLIIAFLTIAIIVDNSNQKNNLTIFPYLFFISLIIGLIHYFAMKQGVKRFKYELEREFFYLTKK